MGNKEVIEVIQSMIDAIKTSKEQNSNQRLAGTTVATIYDLGVDDANSIFIGSLECMLEICKAEE